MFWNNLIQWCRELLFKINPVYGTLLTVSIDELLPIGKTKAIDSNAKLMWPSQYPKVMRSLSSNVVLMYAPEVEEYLESVGAVKMVTTDLGFYLIGAYSNDMKVLKDRMKTFKQEPLVQGLLFAHASQVVEFKLRFM